MVAGTGGRSASRLCLSLTTNCEACRLLVFATPWCNSMMFTDNPSELVHSLETAWDHYRESFDLVLRDCAARVETRRYARDAEYVPNQPLWKLLDTVGFGCEW